MITPNIAAIEGELFATRRDKSGQGWDMRVMLDSIRAMLWHRMPDRLRYEASNDNWFFGPVERSVLMDEHDIAPPRLARVCFNRIRAPFVHLREGPANTSDPVRPGR